jgi:hypothetical protein
MPPGDVEFGLTGGDQWRCAGNYLGEKTVRRSSRFLLSHRTFGRIRFEYVKTLALLFLKARGFSYFFSILFYTGNFSKVKDKISDLCQISRSFCQKHAKFLYTVK